jgi:hypothetical protein
LPAEGSHAVLELVKPMPPEVSNIVLLSDLLAPHEPGERLFAAVDHLGLVAFSEIIVARDASTGREVCVLGRDEYDRLSDENRRDPGLMLTVLLDLETEFDELMQLVKAVVGQHDVADYDDDKELDDVDDPGWEEVGDDDADDDELDDDEQSGPE